MQFELLLRPNYKNITFLFHFVLSAAVTNALRIGWRSTRSTATILRSWWDATARAPRPAPWSPCGRWPSGSRSSSTLTTRMSTPASSEDTCSSTRSQSSEIQTVSSQERKLLEIVYLKYHHRNGGSYAYS